MKTCQAEATTKNLSGEPRQRYVNACLSGNAAAGTNAAPSVAGNSGRFASEAEAKRVCGGGGLGQSGQPGLPRRRQPILRQDAAGRLHVPPRGGESRLPRRD